jgi:hypothetical protein
MQPIQPKKTAMLFLSLSFVLFAVFTATLYANTTAPTIYWHPASNGLPSDVQSLVAAPLSPTLLYAGTWGGGVYRSADHGAVWITATAGLTLPMYVRSGLAVNPVTPTTLYAGDYYGGLSGGGVYRSLDGGDSWTLTLPDANVEALLVHPITPTLVFAGDREKGLYRSDDGGDSWDSASLPAQRVQALAAATVPPGPVYAGVDSDLYVSADGGLSWKSASSLASTVEALAVHPTTPTLLYAGMRSHGVWRSDDGGATWITQTTGLPANAWVTSLAIHPLTPTIVYAGVWQGQVYRSTDGGNLWEGLGYLGPVEAVLVHPAAPSVIYAGTSNNGVFRGSTLHHLTMVPVDSPQYVNRAFPIAVTARDELGFPLTGPTEVELAAWARHDPALAETLAAGGFSGTATLTDTTGTIQPTEITFADGVATANVKIAAPVTGGTLTATVPNGPAVTSNPFDVISLKVYLPVVMSND